MHTRREVMKRSAAVAAMLAAAGYLPQVAFAQAAGYASAAFEAKSVADVLKALGAAAPADSPDISVQGPDIAENGAVVPLGANITASGVKRVLLLVEKNPFTLAAMFEPGDSVEPSIATRVKMGQSSNVYAVALMNDGRVLYAHKEIKVTLGGCGG